MNRDGFSLVEVMVAMLILVVGVLGLAGSTGFVSMQLHAADIRTERSVARQQVVERIRLADFETGVVSRAAGSAVTVGAYDHWWDVTQVEWGLKQVDIYAQGPAFVGGQLQNSVVDTLTLLIPRPLP